MAQTSRDWSVFKQIFVDHWPEFQQFRPRYNTPYYDSLVEKMLDCGNPDRMGYILRSDRWLRDHSGISPQHGLEK
jgi:hypothetical protein